MLPPLSNLLPGLPTDLSMDLPSGRADVALGPVAALDIKPEMPPVLPTAANPRWVEVPRDMAITDFFAEIAEYCDLTLGDAVWRHVRAAEPVFTLNHPMRPDAGMEHTFPLRDPADPMRVHPRYAGPDGQLRPGLGVHEVQPLVQPLRMLMRLCGIAAGEHRRLCQALADDVRREMWRLIEGRRDAPRYEVRRLQASALPAHERALAGQYGLFVWPDQPPDQRPTLGNGRVMGLFVGALLENNAQESAYASSHPGYNSYMVDFRLRDGRMAGLTGLGAANGPSFANTALLPGTPARYDRERLNAHLMPFHVRLAEAGGRTSRATVVALITTDAAYGPGNPSCEIRVDYGPHFLREFDECCSRSRTASPALIKAEPMELPDPFESLEPIEPFESIEPTALMEPVRARAEDTMNWVIAVAPDPSRDSSRNLRPRISPEALRTLRADMAAMATGPWLFCNQLRALHAMTLAWQRGWRLTQADVLRLTRLSDLCARRLLRFCSRPEVMEVMVRLPVRAGDTLQGYLSRLAVDGGLPADMMMLGNYVPQVPVPAQRMPSAPAGEEELQHWESKGAQGERRAEAAWQIRRVRDGGASGERVGKRARAALDLADLGLCDLPPLSACVRIVELDLSGNRLRDFRGLAPLRLLRRLDLRRNGLLVLPGLPLVLSCLHLGDNPGLGTRVSGMHDDELLALGHLCIIVGVAGHYRAVRPSTRRGRDHPTGHPPLGDWGRQLVRDHPRRPTETVAAYARRLVLSDESWRHRSPSEWADVLDSIGLLDARVVRQLSGSPALMALMRRHPQIDGEADVSYAQRLLVLGGDPPALRTSFRLSRQELAGDENTGAKVKRTPRSHPSRSRAPAEPRGHALKRGREPLGALLESLRTWAEQGPVGEHRAIAAARVVASSASPRGELDLSGLGLSSLPPLDLCASLRLLNASGNRLREVPPLSELDGIRVVLLHHNDLQSLPLFDQRLIRLDISSNPALDHLAMSPPAVGGLGHRCVVVGASATIATPLPSIVSAQGTLRPAITPRRVLADWQRTLLMVVPSRAGQGESPQAHARRLVLATQLWPEPVTPDRLLEMVNVSGTYASSLCEAVRIDGLPEQMRSLPQDAGESDKQYGWRLLEAGAPATRVQRLFDIALGVPSARRSGERPHASQAASPRSDRQPRSLTPPATAPSKPPNEPAPPTGGAP